MSVHHAPVALLQCKLAPLKPVVMRSHGACLLHKHASSSTVTCKSVKAEVQIAGEVENVVPPTETKRLRVYYIRQEGDTKVTGALFIAWHQSLCHSCLFVLSSEENV